MSNANDLELRLNSANAVIEELKGEIEGLQQRIDAAEADLLSLRDTLRALASGVAGAAKDATDAWAAI